VASDAITGTAEDVDRQARRQVRVTKEHKSEVQRLLKLMGIPFHDVRAPPSPLPWLFVQRGQRGQAEFEVPATLQWQAPSEAEAQCAEFCRGNVVYGTGSEDMDTLTFNSPLILRHLTFSEARKMPIDVIRLDAALEGLELTMDQVGVL
jgi:flap endonuclease-1